VTSYPTPARRRTALAPSIVAALSLIAAVLLIGSDGFTWIRYLASILALIVSVFAWQAGHWWWLIGLIPVAIAWNPIVPIDLSPPQFAIAAHYLAAGLFIAAGTLISVPNGDDRNRR
jgi:hypothetical protein